MESQVEQWIDELMGAERDKRPIRPLSKRGARISLRDAYRVQEGIARRRLDGGAALVGMKVGLSSPRIQEQFNVHEPIFGLLVSPVWGLHRGLEAIPHRKIMRPWVEPELAFVFRRELRGPEVTEVDVLGASAGVLPAIEINESRYSQTDVSAADIVADSAFVSGVILGSPLRSVDRIDLRSVGLVLERNGAVIDTSAGATVYEHPARSVAWLANKLAEHGRSILPGQFVISGSFTRAYPASRGDRFRASFGSVGQVEVLFA